MTALSHQTDHSYLAWADRDSQEETCFGEPISREPGDNENGGPPLQSVSHQLSPRSDVSPRRSSDTSRQDIILFVDFDGVHAGALLNGYDDQAANLDPRRSTHPQTSARPMPCMEPTPSDNIIYHPAPAPRNSPNVPAISNEVHVARSAFPIVISLYLVLFTTGMQHPLRLETVDATLRERVVDKKRKHKDVVKVKLWEKSKSKSRKREGAAVAIVIEQSRACDCERLERAKAETNGVLRRVKILIGKFRPRERRHSYGNGTYTY